MPHRKADIFMFIPDQSVPRTAFSLARFFPATSATSAPGPFSPAHAMSVLLCIQAFS
jgi:hypothetical protein